MQVEYDILTNVLFRHRYFSNGRLECLTVRPDKETAAVLLNRGLVFKLFKDGFTVLYEAFHNGQAREKSELIKDNITLRFCLTLTDANFFNYTDGGIENIPTSVYYFHNKNDQRVQSNYLNQEEFVSSADVVSHESFGEISFTKPFAFIDITIHSDLQAEYMLSFKEKQTYWRYVLVSDHLKDLQQPAILGEEEVFTGPDKLTLPDKKEALSFVSSSPISLKQIASKQFKLVENYQSGSAGYKTIIRSLPGPDVSRISSIGDRDTKNTKTTYSEIFIY